MTPDEELDALEMLDTLKDAGIGAVIVWPHEEVLSMDQTSITVFDKQTDTIRTKHV